MPSAETLVKPAGSTRVTLAVSGGPPQPSTVAVAPSRTFTASTDSNSTTSSRLAGSPISTSGVPASDHPLALLDQPQDPAAHGRAHRHAASDRHLALPGLLRADQPAPGALQLALAHLQIGLGPRQRRPPRIGIDPGPLQRALGDRLGRISGCARASSLSANSSSDSAWRISASASATAALAASTCASSSRRARTSRNGGAIGSMMATVVTSFLTRSPASSDGAPACR